MFLLFSVGCGADAAYNPKDLDKPIGGVITKGDRFENKSDTESVHSEKSSPLFRTVTLLSLKNTKLINTLLTLGMTRLMCLFHLILPFLFQTSAYYFSGLVIKNKCFIFQPKAVRPLGLVSSSKKQPGKKLNSALKSFSTDNLTRDILETKNVEIRFVF